MTLFARMQQSFFRAIYKVLGPNLATDLAKSYFGKIITQFLYGNSQGLAIYSTLDNIKLKLTRAEAAKFGFLYLGALNLYETELIKKILKPGDIFIDVGCYVDGWHSLVASTVVGQTGQVHSFEPIYHHRFSANVNLNKIKNITVNPFAVADRDGQAVFYKNDEESSLTKPDLKTPKLKVKVVKLDSYVKERGLAKIALIKIDTEGAETKVLRGAVNLLARKAAPDLLVEVIDESLKRSGSSRAELLKLLKGLGFYPFTVGATGLQKYTKKSDQQMHNLYFSKKNKNK